MWNVHKMYSKHKKYSTTFLFFVSSGAKLACAWVLISCDNPRTALGCTGLTDSSISLFSFENTMDILKN